MPVSPRFSKFIHFKVLVMCKLEFKSFAEMLRVLPDEKSCREYLEDVLWEGKPKCPHCEGQKAYKLNVKGEFNGLYKCGTCRKRYTVRVGTIFENSPIGLRHWFIAVYLFSSHKRGISSYQLAEDLGLTQKTAWFMLSRIRHSYKQDVPDIQQDMVITMDETFVGGKNKNRHADKKVKQSQGRSYKDKTPVFGMMQDGKVYTKVVPDTKSMTLQPLVWELVPQGSTIVTDEWTGYAGLDRYYNQKVVNHGAKNYVTDDGYTSNPVENHWSHLKRSIIGTYYQVSRKHLQKYCDEMAFRYNEREEKPTQKFNLTLLRMGRENLKYADLIQK